MPDVAQVFPSGMSGVLERRMIRSVRERNSKKCLECLDRLVTRPVFADIPQTNLRVIRRYLCLAVLLVQLDAGHDTVQLAKDLIDWEEPDEQLVDAVRDKLLRHCSAGVRPSLLDTANAVAQKVAAFRRGRGAVRTSKTCLDILGRVFVYFKRRRNAAACLHILEAALLSMPNRDWRGPEANRGCPYTVERWVETWAMSGTRRHATALWFAGSKLVGQVWHAMNAGRVLMYAAVLYETESDFPAPCAPRTKLRQYSHLRRSIHNVNKRSRSSVA